MTIKEMAKVLKLSYLYNYEEILKEANQLKLSNEDFLICLLEREIEQRRNNGITKRLREAKFPLRKYLEDFDKTKYLNDMHSEFNELETLDFIKAKENIILMGAAGAGKTHYAVGLGVKACMKGMSVLFTSVPNLIIEIKEAMSQNALMFYKKRFERYTLVILDELGYISFDKNGCEMLFNLLSNRNDKGSIIITTNLTFDRWEEIFKDPMLTGAIVDRLAHKAHVLDFSREKSHRFEETEEWKKNTIH